MSTKAESSAELPLTEAQQLAKIRDAIETALATESLRDSVVTRELADILGLPHGGPQPGNFVGRARKNLADKGYNCLKTPEGLHPNTVTLVLQFAGALAEKLKAAQDKYGYSNGWMDPSWMDECRAKLRDHLQKGDPRDVAAYCAFLWHHGASTAIEQSEDSAQRGKQVWAETIADEEQVQRAKRGHQAFSEGRYKVVQSEDSPRHQPTCPLRGQSAHPKIVRGVYCQTCLTFTPSGTIQANGASQALAAIDKCFGPRCAGETHAKHDEHILQEIEAILRAHYGGGK